MDNSNTIPSEKMISENRPLFTNRPYPPGPERPFADPYKTEDLPEPVFLIQKHSKGLKKLLFSRAGLFVILILIQIGIIYLAYWVLADHLKNFATWRSLFIAAMLVHLVNNNMNSSAKLTWMVLIMIIPIPASLLLFYQNKSVGTRKIKKSLEQNIKE
nr:PLD nuclease N-terminal domain-containing protein [Lachnospiraceae bacterium]